MRKFCTYFIFTTEGLSLTSVVLHLCAIIILCGSLVFFDITFFVLLFRLFDVAAAGLPDGGERRRGSPPRGDPKDVPRHEGRPRHHHRGDLQDKRHAGAAAGRRRLDQDGADAALQAFRGKRVRIWFNKDKFVSQNFYQYLFF